MARRRGVDREALAVADALHDYDDTYLSCRRGNLGHVWRNLGFFRAASGAIARRVACDRCGTWRTDLWETRGGRIGSRYQYAEGYRIEGAQPDTVAVRVEVMRRATVYENEEQMLGAITNGSAGGRRRG